MKQKIYCHWLIIAVGIVIFGIILDIGVEVTGFSVFTATEAFMDYIFSAIVSVGLLSFSLIALVSGILQQKYYGYKLSELLVFEGIKKRINLRRYLITSLLQVLMGIFLLSMFFRVSCVNSMIYLLVSAVFSAGCMAYSIFDIMVNEQAVYKILEDGYEYLLEKDLGSNNRYLYHINTLSNALIEATEKGDLEVTEDMCSLYAVLLQVIDKNDIEWEQISFLESRLQQVCCNISKSFGYIKMIHEVTKMFINISKYDYWKVELYSKPVHELKYFNDEQLEKYDYRNQILVISALQEYKDGLITEDEWEKILQEYFLSLVKNKSCTFDIRHEMINKYISELVNFNGRVENGKLLVEEIAALNVVNYILNTDDKAEQEYLYKIIIRNIAVHNQYKESLDYNLFLSIMVQVFYSYAYTEREVRTKGYRENIRRLMNIEISDDIISGLKVSFLLDTKIEQIIFGLGYRIPKDLQVVNIFEASADFIRVKYKVWTEEYNLKFFFMLYCQYFDQVGFWGVTRFCRWNEYTIETKSKFLKNIIKFFDLELGLLQEEFVKECRRLGELYNHNYVMTDTEQNRVYELLQKMQRELIDIQLSEEHSDDKGNMDTRKIANHLDENMKRKKIFGWAPERKMEFYIKFSNIEVVMHYQDDSNIMHENTVAHFIEDYGQEVFNSFIKNKCKKVLLTYDGEGINKVLNYIEHTDYSIRNFSYASDIALIKYSEMEEYQALREKESEIELCEIKFVYEHIYARKEKFYFKLVPSKARKGTISDEESLKILEKSNRYKDYYYVDGVLLDRNRAIECIKRKYYRYEFDFKLYIGFEPEDVTWFYIERY